MQENEWYEEENLPLQRQVQEILIQESTRHFVGGTAVMNQQEQQSQKSTLKKATKVLWDC